HAYRHRLSSILEHRATPQTDTLSLHDALPILGHDVDLPAVGLDKHLGQYLHRLVIRLPRIGGRLGIAKAVHLRQAHLGDLTVAEDRKSTRLNSSHVKISYAVLCLKKKTGRPHA